MVTAFSCHDYQTRSIASRIPYRSRQTPQRHLVHAHAEARLDPVADVPRDSLSIVRHAAPASAGIVFHEVGAVGGPDQVPPQGLTAAGGWREDIVVASPAQAHVYEAVPIGGDPPVKGRGATDPCFVSRAVRAGARPSFSMIAGLDTVPAVPGRRRWLPPPRTHRTRCPPTRSPADGDVQAALLSVAAKARTIKLLQG